MTDEHHSIQGCLRFRRLSFEDLFGKLSPSAQLSLSGITNTIHLEKDNILIAKGDLYSVYILKKGRAAAHYYNHLTKKETNIPILRNEIIGFAETLSCSYSMLEIKAITYCVFKTINRPDLVKFLSEQPAICMRILKKLSSNVAESYKNIDF